MKRKGCGYSTIPAVDNSDEKCEDYFLADCIIVKEPIPYLGSASDESIKEIFLKISEMLKVQGNLIEQLRVEIASLKGK